MSNPPISDPALAALVNKPQLSQPALPTKTYYSHVPATTIYVMKGPGICEPVMFVNHRCETSDQDAIAYLDKIVDRPGSGIVSKSNAQVAEDVLRAQAEAMEAAKVAHAKMLAAGLTT